MMAPATMPELIALWKTDEGKPSKGRLIDLAAWFRDPGDIGCMCAQGQVLHLLGGWTPEELHAADQAEADIASARRLNISVAHSALLRLVNDTADGAPASVLTHPERVMGDQASRVLDFWWYLDRMDDSARAAPGAAARAAAGAAAGAAAWDAAGAAAWDAAWAAPGAAARAAAGASNEIQGARILHERGQGLFFLPLFGIATPEAIPPRPADYGKRA